MSEEIDQQAQSVSPRNRRTKNWWEPMYSGNNCPDFKLSDWDFTNNEGPRNLLFRAEELSNASVKSVSMVTFKDCDFEGDIKTKLIFKDCRFEKCDFGLSTFHRAKFTNCTFVETSFSQSEFRNCEFRNCTYSGISFSGNETELPSTLITEPNKFIFGGSAAVGNVPDGKSRVIQRLRFEETRSTLSRSILANLQSEGSEDTFYSAVRTASVCEDRARFAKGALKAIALWEPEGGQSIFNRLWGFVTGIIQCIFSVLSLTVLILMGWLNGWGGNISRVLLVGVVLVLAIAYRVSYKYNIEFGQALTKSIETFLLFGYTNHAKATEEDFSLVFATALCGVFWYALAIPTVMNRLTRPRG